MTRSVLTGHIHYTSDKPGREGEERGREFFTILCNADGSRTMQAHCEIDDPPSVLRLVTTSMNARWEPLDAFVRLIVGDRLFGSTWYRFTAASAECEGLTMHAGRISQRFELPASIHGFGAHPLQNDAWQCARYDVAQGPGTMRLKVLLSSDDHRGATGPTLVPVETDLHYVGRERIEVAAGTFDALHFRFGQDGGWAEDDDLKHPEYHLWCSADGDYLFLRGWVSGYMKTRYELVRLDRR